jgi:RimJ/RimL family protein N-acetyltransferase
MNNAADVRPAHADRIGTADDSATTATLLDGATVTIRRLVPDDYDAVVALALTLNDQERYMRFFTVHPAYIGEWALALTAPAVGMVALGAFEATELIGVANYAVTDQPGYAEIAAVVAHDQHDRGVGTALLRTLGHLARRAGQRHLVADVLAENHAMRRVISDAGWPTTQHHDAGVLSIDINLDNLP